MDILHFLGVAFSWGFLVFWIWMLVDCIKNEEDSIERVTWAIGMIFCAPLFPAVYFFRCYLPRRREKAAEKPASSEDIGTL